MQFSGIRLGMIASTSLRVYEYLIVFNVITATIADYKKRSCPLQLLKWAGALSALTVILVYADQLKI